jgi:ribosome-associated protein
VKTKSVKIKANEEYITLQNLLKICDIIPTGGMAKFFLMENEVLVNNTPEDRRGRKLYDGDVVKVLNQEFKVVK